MTVAFQIGELWRMKVNAANNEAGSVVVIKVLSQGNWHTHFLLKDHVKTNIWCRRLIKKTDLWLLKDFPSYSMKSGLQEGKVKEDRCHSIDEKMRWKKWTNLTFKCSAS